MDQAKLCELPGVFEYPFMIPLVDCAMKDKISSRSGVLGIFASMNRTAWLTL